jgi:hypothetical protein
LFAAIDVLYAIRRRISRIYLLDAAFEIAVLIGLVIAWWTASHATRELERILMTTRLRRVLVITAALAGLGAVVGGMLGALLVSALMVVPPRTWSATVLFVGAEFGAAVGFVLAPIAAWTLMRRVPIWRAIVDTSVGTTIGAGLGLLLQPRFTVLALSPVVLGVVGFAAAALRLRIFYRGDAAVKLPT